MQAHTPGFFALLVNFYGYYLPLILLCVWTPLALIDLARRDDLKGKSGMLWTLAIVGVPFVGAFAYHVSPGSRVSPGIKKAVVYGGLGLFVLFVIIASIMKY